MEQKILTPNDFLYLADLERLLIIFQSHYKKLSNRLNEDLHGTSLISLYRIFLTIINCLIELMTKTEIRQRIYDLANLVS